MKYKNLFWGIILVFLGILGLLDNFDLIYFSWHKLWNLWPVFLILWGISVLPVKDALKITFVLLVLGFTMYYISVDAVDKDVAYSNRWTTYDNDDDENLLNDDTVSQSSVSASDETNPTFLIPYPENIKNATLSFDAVAGQFLLNQSTNNLTTFNIDDNYLSGKYTYSVKTTGSKANVNIGMKKHINIDLDGHDAKAVLKLNENPVWTIDIDAGAADLDLNFSKFKVKKLTIDAGAASIDVKLGNKIKKVLVDIDAGAAEITVRIPKAAACVVDIDTFLSDKDLAGFVKRNGKYYSENYNNSDMKIDITIDSAISDLNIIRY